MTTMQRASLHTHSKRGLCIVLILFCLCGTGLVRLPQMMKAGFWLNLTGILVITALVTLFIAPLLGNGGLVQ